MKLYLNILIIIFLLHSKPSLSWGYMSILSVPVQIISLVLSSASDLYSYGYSYYYPQNKLGTKVRSKIGRHHEEGYVKIDKNEIYKDLFENKEKIYETEILSYYNPDKTIPEEKDGCQFKKDCTRNGSPKTNKFYINGEDVSYKITDNEYIDEVLAKHPTLKDAHQGIFSYAGLENAKLIKYKEDLSNKYDIGSNQYREEDHRTIKIDTNTNTADITFTKKIILDEKTIAGFETKEKYNFKQRKNIEHRNKRL